MQNYKVSGSRMAESKMETEEVDVEDGTPEPGFDYSKNEEPFCQGAEARIFEAVFLGKPAIVKQRFSKSYRHPTLDIRLNKARVKAELKGMAKARQLGVDTPVVYFVNEDTNEVILERVAGCSAKNWIEQARQEKSEEDFRESLERLGHLLGESVAKMHQGSLIHGDLTTSNILLRHDDPSRVCFIDFGLATQAKVTAEEKGVDLYVWERSVASTHIGVEALLKAFFDGYIGAGKKHGNAVIAKLNEIRLRGRKRDMTG